MNQREAMAFGQSWSEGVAQQLLDARTCPACGVGQLIDGWCPDCWADLRGPAGQAISQASANAAAALRARQGLTAQVPRMAPAVTPLAAALTAPAALQGPAANGLLTPGAAPRFQLATPATPASPAAPTLGTAPTSSATLQSVLAVAGAGLFAVAAIVFTFFNPDLADKALRSIIVGAITLVFVGGAWWLARRKLHFSAEAIGGLALLFAALDVWAFAQLTPPGVSAWWLAAGVTLLVAAACALAGRRTGIRVWLAGALVAAAVTPAMLGFAGGAPFWAALGWSTAAFSAALLSKWLPKIVQRTDVRAEATALEALQLVAVGASLVMIARTLLTHGSYGMLPASGVLIVIAAHSMIASRQRLRRLWSFGIGGSVVSAVPLAFAGAVLQVLPWSDWWLVGVLVATVAALIFVVRILPVPGPVSRLAMVSGGLSVLAVLTAPFVLMVVITFATSGISTTQNGWRDSTYMWVALTALLVSMTGLIALSLLSRRDAALGPLHAFAGVVAMLLGFAALLLWSVAPFASLPTRVCIALGLIAALGLAARQRELWPAAVRVVAQFGAHFALFVVAVVAWDEPRTGLLGGVLALAVLAVLAVSTPQKLRFIHVGAGYAYALVLVAYALTLTHMGPAQLLSLVTSLGLVVAIAATFIRQIGPRSWYAILAVTLVPFVLGVAQVLTDRSGWTALSAAMMCVLALTLLATRRPGLNGLLRVASAAMLVPSLAVSIICLGAELLAVSASPITLPIIAIIVAVVFAGTRVTRLLLRGRGLAESVVGQATRAIEISVLVTGSITVLLALVREAAGFGTTALVLLILGIGAAWHAWSMQRSSAWLLAGASFTGSLWSLNAMLGATLIEAYLLPPALGLAFIAVLLAARGIDTARMYTLALGVGMLPLLVKFAFATTRGYRGHPGMLREFFLGYDGVWRGAELMVLAILLLVLGALYGRAHRGREAAGGQRSALARLQLPSYALAACAAIAGPIQGIRISLDAGPTGLHSAALFFACLGTAAVGALVMALAAQASWRVRPELGRWIWIPAALAPALGAWGAIERDWFSIWAMWTLMIVYLAAMVLVALFPRERRLAPTWCFFAIALVTGIVAWSPRDLRVEWFSLPMGLFLLLAGVIVLRRERAAGESAVPRPRGAIIDWPIGWNGSWPLLAPGITVTLFASILATFTDPQTWRAILVILLGLAAILAGAMLRLAAPFIIGLIVLPIENVIAFSVQIGRGIDSMPWWITLAVVGAVLLIIAVTYERRAGEAGSITARIRDLR